MSFGAKKEEKKKEVVQEEKEVDTEALRRLQQIDQGGKGLRMLKMMGYKGGGLGKEGTGITKAIEAKKREKLEGLGNRTEHKQELKSKEDEKAEKEKKKKAKKPKKEFNWKIKMEDEGPVASKKKKKRVYKTAEEIRQEAEEGRGEKSKGQPTSHVAIVDMRGKEAKLVSGSQVTQIEDTTADEAFTLPLLHNLAVLIEGCESDIISLTRSVATEKDGQVTLEHEVKSAQQRVDEHAFHLHRLEGIIDIISDTYDKAVSKDSLSLDELADVFEELRTTYKAEWALYQLHSLAGPLLVPPMRKFLSAWIPLKDPKGPAQAMKAWRRLLKNEENRARSGRDSPTVLQIRGEGGEDGGEDAAAFVQLVEEVVMPKMMSAAANWTPKWEGTEQLVQLIDAWQAVLPEASHAIFVNTMILPKLKSAVDSWNPKNDPIPIHAWVFPWLPFLGAELEELYPVIRYKIGVALTEWHPSDPSAINILAPWAKVFKPAHMEALLVRCVLPKLAVEVRGMAINPANQTLDPFNWTIAWLGTAPLGQLAAIFNTEFFPRWLQVLFTWLTGRPDYEEVTRWYLNWKSLFPEELQGHELVKPHFTRALDMMNNVVAGAKMTGGFVPAGAEENLGYLRVTESRDKDKPASGSRILPTEPKAKGKMSIADAMYDSSITFKEALEQLAQDNGQLFLPKVGKQQAGKQVYSFGKVAVYLDNRLVYAQEEGGWRPIALDELLKRASKK